MSDNERKGEPMSDKTTADAVMARIQAEIEAEMMGALTTTQVNQPPPLDIEKAMLGWVKMLRNFRRNDLTIEVVQGHIGPMTMTTPVPTRDGLNIFCGKLRLSQRRALAERFGLDMRRDPTETNFERDKGWLLEAKTLGRLDELLAAAIEMDEQDGN